MLRKLNFNVAAHSLYAFPFICNIDKCLKSIQLKLMIKLNLQQLFQSLNYTIKVYSLDKPKNRLIIQINQQKMNSLGKVNAFLIKLNISRGIQGRYIKFKLKTMCYGQSKIRNIKIKPQNLNNNVALIKDKKYLPQNRDKENQKYHLDHNSKIRTLYNNQNKTTTEFENNKLTNTYINVPYSHNSILRDRYAPYHNLQSNFVQTTKTLTFATVKTNNTKPKQQQQSSLLIAQQAKKIQVPKANILMQKQKPNNFMQRNEKMNFQKAVEKKQNPFKANYNNKNYTNTNNASQIDDFTCNQQLQYKPVEKKSIVPQKKYTQEKTTSKFDFSKPKKSEKRNDLKELKQFQVSQKTINMAFDSDSLNFLCLKQEEYSVDPGYLQKNHKTLLWWSRAILVDWMRHICYQFGLQRDTYHIAVVLLDNYLARITNVSKSILQAIGATTLFIASKLEEFQCKQSRQFAKSTNNSCSVQDIHELQIKIVKNLKFKINPPSLFNIANKMMTQWDIFVSSNDYGKCHPLFASKDRVFFKQLDQNSYRMFRQMMQMIDCSVLDIQTAQYKPKMLVCSFMYLLIGRQLGFFNNSQMVKEFPNSSLYLLDESSELNDLFRQFISHVFGFSLFEILPTVQYCASYFQLIFTYEKPILSQEKDLQSMSLQDYCSHQTFNSSMIKIVKSRYRGIYPGMY